jgi:hypothetical protein
MAQGQKGKREEMTEIAKPISKLCKIQFIDQNTADTNPSHDSYASCKKDRL